MEKIVAEHSILFLGSGFSTEAKNRLDKAPPSGDGLTKAIAKVARVQPDKYSLADLAEYCNEIDSKGLFDIVTNSFRIKSLSGNQEAVLSAPWMRIYTTNFDDAAETGRGRANLEVKSHSFEREKPKRIAAGAVVHWQLYT